VLYLIYNAGTNDVMRRDLRAEAIWLTRVLVALMPDEPEGAGLLALMLLSDARMPARGDASRVVLLRDQDRTLWNHSMIAEGQELALACLRRRSLGPFPLQAAIHALHCADPATRRPIGQPSSGSMIVCSRSCPPPVVALNWAIAVAETNGPEASLVLLDGVAQDLDGYHLLHASRAEMLERLGRPGEAAKAYDRAAALARTDADISFLTLRRHAATADASEPTSQMRTDPG
jgi:RNA polymerase sigma-70 factor (ECF subfamily)